MSTALIALICVLGVLTMPIWGPPVHWLIKKLGLLYNWWEAKWII